MPEPTVRSRPGPQFLRRRRMLVYGGLLALLLLGWFVFDLPGLAESRLIYFPSREPFATPLGREDISLKTADGLTLHAWLTIPNGWRPGDPPVPAILHVHGDADHTVSVAHAERLRRGSRRGRGRGPTTDRFRRRSQRPGHRGSGHPGPDRGLPDHGARPSLTDPAPGASPPRSTRANIALGLLSVGSTAQGGVRRGKPPRCLAPAPA